MRVTTLQVILDEMLEPSSIGVDRYASNVTLALIQSAPRDCEIGGIVAASTEAQYAHIRDALPGLTGLSKSALARRELTAAWQHGFTRLPARGMLFAPSLFAPLARHDRLNAGEQIILAVHDAVQWTQPQALSPRVLAWRKAMIRRAERYADAVVVPTHALAASLDEFADFGERVRVVPPAPDRALALPDDADERVRTLELPERYILVRDASLPRARMDSIVDAARSLDDTISVVVVDSSTRAVRAESESNDAIRILTQPDDADVAVAISRAALFIDASAGSENLIHLLDAMELGTPVAHVASAGRNEIAADSTLPFDGDDDDIRDAVTEALGGILDDRATAVRLGLLGSDRASAFSWRSAAENIWQLQADL